MTRFLCSPTRTALLVDLASAGFEFKDENGDTRIPNAYEQTTNGTDACIYLGKIILTPSTHDGNGNVLTEAVYSTDFHANVTACEGITFDTEIEPPTTPYNVFI